MAVIYEILRWEEKAIIKSLRDLGISVIPHYIKAKPVFINGLSEDVPDLAIQRSISHYVAMESTIAFEAHGVRVVNNSMSTAICMDKLWTISLLAKNGIPTPKTAVVFSYEAAQEVANKFNYPLVVKPINGSWGRLISLIRDGEELRSIMEHRTYLPGMLSKAHLMQEYVRKPGRDIRVFVVGDEVPVAIYRINKHWITNTARGGKAIPARVDVELEEISLKAAKIVGGEILGIDVFEDPERGYLVNEINPIPEFKNTVAVTGYDLPRKIAEYLVSNVRQ